MLDLRRQYPSPSPARLDLPRRRIHHRPLMSAKRLRVQRVTANNTIRTKTLVARSYSSSVSFCPAGQPARCPNAITQEMCVGTQFLRVHSMLRLSAGATLDLRPQFMHTASQLYICDTAKSP